MAWTWNRSGLNAFMSRLFSPAVGVEDFPILAALGCSVGGTVNTLTTQPRRCDVRGLSHRDATLAMARHIDALLDRQPETHSELVVRIVPFVLTVDADGGEAVGPWMKVGHYDVMAERPHDWAAGAGAMVLQSQPFELDDGDDAEGDDPDDDDDDDDDPDDDDGGFDDDDNNDIGDDDGEPSDDGDAGEDPEDEDPEDENESDEGDMGLEEDAAATALLDLPPRRPERRPQRHPERARERLRDNHLAPPRARPRRRQHRGMVPMNQPGIYYVQTPQGFMPVMAPPPQPVRQQEGDSGFRDRAAEAYFRLAESAISSALGASERQHKGQQDQVTHLTAALTDANKQAGTQMERVLAAERAAAQVAETRNRDDFRRLELENAATRRALAAQETEASRAVTMLTEELNKQREATARAKAEAKAAESKAASEGSLEERVMEQVVTAALPKIMERVLPSPPPPAPTPQAPPTQQQAQTQTPRRQAQEEVEYIDDDGGEQEERTPAPRRVPARSQSGRPVIRRMAPVAPHEAAAPAPEAAPAADGNPISAAVTGLKQLMSLPKPMRDLLVKQIASTIGEGDFATLMREMNELGDKS